MGTSRQPGDSGDRRRRRQHAGRKRRRGRQIEVAGDVEARMSDAAALDLIARLMCAEEWPISGLEDIAEIIRATGRTISDDPNADWPSH